MKATAYNVAALDQVLRLATQVGDSYKPSNSSIERTALTALLEESRKSITAVLKAEGDLDSAINARQKAFSELPTMARHILKFAESGGMNKEDLQDLDKRRKHLRSQPFHKKATADAATKVDTATNPEPSPVSKVRRNRQLSYDVRMETFESIIKFLEEKPAYNPTESGFTITELKEKLATLHNLSDAVRDAKLALGASRSQSNNIVFDSETGIRAKARLAKKYLEAVLANNPALGDLYGPISKLKFRSR